MSDEVRYFNRYSIWIGGRYQDGVLSVPALASTANAARVDVVAVVYCFRDDDIVGTIYFTEGDGNVHGESNVEAGTPSGNPLAMYMPGRRLQAILLTLRQERPLALLKRTSADHTNVQGYLVTLHKEPVGEEEGTGAPEPTEFSGFNFPGL